MVRHPRRCWGTLLQRGCRLSPARRTSGRTSTSKRSSPVAGAGTVYEPSSPDSALRQGEILSDVVQTLVVIETLGRDRELQVDFKQHPLVIVLSQDCDLDQDYQSRLPNTTKDRTIPNILFCEV